jgi:hypothetical protein
MAHQGYDLQLTRYDEHGWRAAGAFADERDRHRLGTHAMACDAANGVGGVDES